ncbi:MAG: AmmeMemoRadiSam system protein A [Candidatus Cloacimonetes bacterium]|nr:AmmeMemoRadiSam system protein A [Candidatus Cloacimonadota bacterium]
MTKEQKQTLLKTARNSIATRFNSEQVSEPLDPCFQEKRGLFVSLHSHGQLRGCIGYIRGYKSIAASIMEMAKAAAFQDPRFPPVKESEIKDLEIEISILSEMERVQNPDNLVIGRDGLYLEHPYGSGLLLPQVAVEWNWDVPKFLKQICQKAGLHAKAWQDQGAILYSFTAEIFSESEFFD